MEEENGSNSTAFIIFGFLFALIFIVVAIFIYNLVLDHKKLQLPEATTELVSIYS